MIPLGEHEYLLGVDFGTTKTLVASYPLLQPDAGAAPRIFDRAIPTQVALPLSSGAWLIGEQVRQANPETYKTVEDLKREIASPNIVQRNWRRAEIAGGFLAKIRQQFEDNGRCRLHGLTLTVPAKWSVEERQATLYAARIAGFRCPVALLEEPLAAFLRSYAEDPRLLDKYGRIVVLDFGGGTCDISLIEADPASALPLVIRSETVRVGGREIDEAIACWWLSNARIPWKGARHKPEMSAVKFIAEGVKMRLSKTVRQLRTEGAPFGLEDIVESERRYYLNWADKYLEPRLSAAELEKLVQNGLDGMNVQPHQSGATSTNPDPVRSGFLAPLGAAMEEVLSARTANGNQIPVGAVLFSGGSCELWVIQDFVTGFFRQRFPEAQIAYLPAPDASGTIQESVALGAAWHQMYAVQGDQMAIPSLNYPIAVSVSCNGEPVRSVFFPKGVRLPVSRWDAIRKGLGYIHLFARGKHFEVRVEQQHKRPYTAELVPERGMTPLAELAWLCSLDEYGLVRFEVRIIDMLQFKRMKDQFYVRPMQKEFDLNEASLAKLQEALGIYG